MSWVITTYVFEDIKGILENEEKKKYEERGASN